jgi:hypothetical protein
MSNSSKDSSTDANTGEALGRTVAGSSSAVAQSGGVKRRRLTITAAVLLVVLFILSGTFWLRIRDRFVIPPEATGSYSGVIKLPDGTQLPVALELDESRLFVALLSKNSVAIERPRSESGSLMLARDGLTVTLKGQVNEYDEFVGVAETSTGQKGVYRFGRRTEPRALSDKGLQEAQSWVLLSAELGMLEEKLSRIAGVKDGKNEEIARLRSFVADKPRLRAGADQKFSQVSAQLQAAKDELNSRLERARKLEASLGLAQRVTPFGRLVTLARESNERELRWVESMLRVGDQVGPAGIEDEVRRGFELLELKNRVEQERERVLQLGGDPDA